jgi:pyroglutamyl-peptidase
MTHIVLTGFAPFGGETINPSWLAVEHVRTYYRPPAQVQLSTLQLPVTFADCFTPLKTLLGERPADLVICVGQAGGRSMLSLEKVAINYVHARIADNAGEQPFDQAVLADAPTAYFSSLPLGAMLQACHDANVPAHVSYTAGTFVCNALFYQLMHFVHTQHRATAAGFVHIPYAPSQVVGKTEPCMEVERIAQGLICCIEAFLAGSPATMMAEFGALD